MGEPARGYSWEPFSKGNTAALKHGGRSERLLHLDAVSIIEKAVEVVPYLARDEFAAALQAWARSEAMARRYFSAVVKRLEAGDLPEGRDGAFERWRAAERLARDLRKDLGLDPEARVRLENTFASAHREAAIADLAKEGRRALAQRGDAPPRRSDVSDGEETTQ